MPTYTFTCKACDITVEQQRSIKDEATPLTCERCKETMKRIFNVGAVTFNGTGFYRTDNA